MKPNRPIRVWMWKAKGLAPAYGCYTLKESARVYAPPRGCGYSLVRVEIRELKPKRRAKTGGGA